MRVICEPSIAAELSDHMTFTVPGYKFTPAGKGGWDGKIRLFDRRTNQIYAGLIDKVKKFAKDRGYKVLIDSAYQLKEFSLIEAQEFIDTLGLPENKKPRPYQVEAFARSVRRGRALILSPTSSGKSLLIYLLYRYYNTKTLLIVPTTALVNQMFKDFKEYGYDSEAFAHMVYSGKERETDKPLVISTWQTVARLSVDWVKQYNAVIGDEAHLFTAGSLKKILESMTKIDNRFGTTGTLDGSKTNELVLQGLFGPVFSAISTRELIDQKYAADFRIKAIVLKHPDADRRLISKAAYKDEIDFIVGSPSRLRFLRNLALSLEGNTLLLFQLIEKHGTIIHDAVLAKAGDRPVYFIHGGVDGEDRDKIREIVETQNNAIIIASVGTFAVGVNIVNLSNVIFGSPSRSRIRVLQSIGRALRRNENKQKAVLYDIADNLSWLSKENHTLRHYRERLKYYDQEQFEYKVYEVELK